MGTESRGYTLSFMEISPLVPEKKIFEEFLPYMGVAADLRHVKKLHFHVPKSLHIYLVKMAQWFLRKASLSFFRSRSTNPGSSFNQTMFDSSPRFYYIPSFVEIGLMVPEKKIFEGFLPYMGVAVLLIM